MNTERQLGSSCVLEDTIGRGAMGQVWRGQDQDGHRLAFNLLRPELTEKPNVVSLNDLVVEGDTDVESVRDTSAKQLANAEESVKDPVGALGSALLNALVNSGPIRRVDAYTRQNCPDDRARPPWAPPPALVLRRRSTTHGTASQEELMSNQTPRPSQPTNPPVSGDPRPSGWQTAGSVAHGIGWFIMKLYGVGLVILAIVSIVEVGKEGIWIGLALLAYGIYLVAPGNTKTVIY